MNCCDKVEEIHKYLGIEKLKRNKFPISKAFLAPGGKGEEQCFDQYEINQALFRMLANGLIINPQCKPGGLEWQNSNATSWAAQMYEMQAESMSDGNQSQKVEVSVMMQLSQAMMLIAELTKKVEFLVDAIGIQPKLKTELLPICFTIHESHTKARGFDPKKPKGKPEIDIGEGTGTDDKTEKTIVKMLQPSLIPITVWQFDPNNISLVETLRG